MFMWWNCSALPQKYRLWSQSISVGIYYSHLVLVHPFLLSVFIQTWWQMVTSCQRRIFDLNQGGQILLLFVCFPWKRRKTITWPEFTHSWRKAQCHALQWIKTFIHQTNTTYFSKPCGFFVWNISRCQNRLNKLDPLLWILLLLRVTIK